MRIKGAASFTMGAMLSGGLVYGVLGALGRLLGGQRVFAPVAAILLGWCAIWYLRGRGRVPFGRAGIQARRALVTRGYVGLGLFGAILGVGFLTEMSTPLVQAGCALALAQQPFFGVCYGMGFGMGRAVGPWIGAVAPRRVSMQALARPFLDWKANSRWPGLALTILPLVFVLYSMWPRAHITALLPGVPVHGHVTGVRRHADLRGATRAVHAPQPKRCAAGSPACQGARVTSRLHAVPTIRSW